LMTLERDSNLRPFERTIVQRQKWLLIAKLLDHHPSSNIDSKLQ
jgi:hypothetical protein